MPHTESAKKRMKTSQRARLVNRSVRSAISKAKKALVAAVEGGDAEKASGKLRSFFAVVDNAAKRGIIKANTADRKKSRAAILVKKCKPHQASTTASTTE